MNKVILEGDLNNKKIKYFIKRISNNKSDFEISNSLKKDISLIPNRGGEQ